MRATRRHLAATGSLVGLAVFAAACGDERPRPDIFLITADTLRADHLSINGYPRATSPRIDAFAETAWHFKQAISVIPKTVPAFATMFTGKHPEEHGVRDNSFQIPPDLTVLAESLVALGYRTAAFVGNPGLSPKKGFARGFQVFRRDRTGQMGRAGVESLNRSFFKWLESESGSPRFGWLHYLDPHGPYTPPPDLEALFIDDDLARGSALVSLDTEAARSEGGDSNKLLGAVPAYQQRAGEQRVAVYVARYDAEIRLVDTAFGEVLDFLRERGLYDGAAILFTSDHGESLGEHDYFFEHGWFAFDPTLRVPLMVKAPGQTRGRVVEEGVSHLDFPAIARALAGTPSELPEPELDLLRVLGERRPVVVENSDSYPHKYVGVRTPRWKLLMREGDGDLELYDLAKDPGETNNLAERAPEALVELRRQLDEALIGLRASARAPLPSEEEAGIRERLRELGYLE